MVVRRGGLVVESSLDEDSDWQSMRFWLGENVLVWKHWRWLWVIFFKGAKVVTWCYRVTSSERLGVTTCPTGSRWTNVSSFLSVSMCREGINDDSECWKRWSGWIDYNENYCVSQRKVAIGLGLDMKIEPRWTGRWRGQTERDWKFIKFSTSTQFRVLFIELGLGVSNAADFAGISLRPPGNWFEQARCPRNLSRQTHARQNTSSKSLKY